MFYKLDLVRKIAIFPVRENLGLKDADEGRGRSKTANKNYFLNIIVLAAGWNGGKGTDMAFEALHSTYLDPQSLFPGRF